MTVQKLNVGTGFEMHQLEYFIALNERYTDVKIGSVFGSLRTEFIDIRSARPDYRLRSTDLATFERFVKRANDAGIEVEYTANASLFCDVETLYSQKNKLIELFKYLEAVGVCRVIVSNPLIMELVSESTSLRQKISTILGVNKCSAIRYYADYHVDSICTDIYANRNLPLLKMLAAEGKKHGIEIELLANEICLYGDTPCSNMLRSSCYQHSSMGGNPNARFDNWPFARCQAEREKHPISWLKCPYILPTHLDTYTSLTGITKFKVSGRTNTWEYLKRVCEDYMAKRFSGCIKNLFMLPQNAVPNANGEITAERLEELGFFGKFFDSRRGCDYNCETCGHCQSIYEKL